MHDTTELFYPERWTTNAPYVSSLTLASGQFSNPFASYVSATGAIGDPFPGAAVFPNQGTYISVPPNMRVTYMMQWNLSYQRQLGRDWLVTANYLGNASRHIWGSIDVNYAVPIAGATTSNTNNRRITYLVNPTTGQAYSDIQQTDDGANSEYHGLLVRVDHRFAHHFTMGTTYSWSHCVSSWDFAGELAGTVYQNPTNRATGERGNCGFDHRQVFNTTLVALSPGFGNGAVMRITKDWQVSPLASMFTGNPIQITDGKDISLSGQSLDRPDVILPTQVYPGQKTPLEYFNPAAFQCAGSNAACTVSTGLFGNLGRNAVYGPSQVSWDIALSRRFPIRERWKFEFRADFFNLLNHGNWNSPTTSVTSGTFGQVTSFGSPRLIQMAVKLFF